MEGKSRLAPRSSGRCDEFHSAAGELQPRNGAVDGDAGGVGPARRLVITGRVDGRDCRFGWFLVDRHDATVSHDNAASPHVSNSERAVH